LLFTQDHKLSLKLLVSKASQLQGCSISCSVFVTVRNEVTQEHCSDCNIFYS